MEYCDEDDEYDVDEAYEYDVVEEQVETAMVRMLNIHNSNYIWLKFDNTDLSVLALIDSGAQVSVLPKKLYDRIPTNVRRRLRRTEIQIYAGNGTAINCFGVTTLAFNFQDMHL